MTDAVAEALKIAKPHTGPIHNSGPGRTDTVPLDVPGESFVIPADVVSALGQGNTANGQQVLSKMFPSPTAKRATGGAVPIVAAGGEYVVGPEHVARVGGGDVKKGHEALRDFVHHVRKKNIKTLRKLRGPVMS